MKINIHENYLQLVFDRVIPKHQNNNSRNHKLNEVYEMVEDMHSSLVEFNKGNWPAMNERFKSNKQWFFIFVNYLYDLTSPDIYDSDHANVEPFINEFVKCTYLIKDDSQEYVAHAIIGAGNFDCLQSLLNKEEKSMNKIDHTELFIIKMSDIPNFFR